MDQSSDRDRNLSILITDVSRGGSGLGQGPDGRVVFVPYTAPGDRVRVEVYHDDKRYSHANPLTWEERSDERVEPACQHFGACGGCEWQHLAYDRQWQIKREGIIDAMHRAGIEVPSVFEEFPAAKPLAYRNRIQLRGQDGQVGYYRRGSRDLVPISHCPVARPEIETHLQNPAQPYPKEPFKLELEVGEDGEVREHWNQRHAAGGFRQVNDDQNEVLKRWVHERVPEGRAVLDLFGGSGNLSLGLEGRVPRVDCVDVTAPREESTKWMHFHSKPVLSWLKAVTRTAKPPGPRTAILDPPREGLGKNHAGVARGLAALDVDTILSIGCDLDSWCRDIKGWLKGGFVLEEIAAFDFFPQTHHVECAGLLRRP